MIVECNNSAETDAAFERVKREGLRVVGMAVMPKNPAGWILTTTDPPAQRDLFKETSERRIIGKGGQECAAMTSVSHEQGKRLPCQHVQGQ